MKTTDTWLAGKGYTKGDQLMVVELPFGSFTPEQPAATIDIAALLSNLADLNQSLAITARGGYRFGADALNNPATDPSIYQTSPASVTVQPNTTLITLTKTYIGPEDETATGPNFPRRYRLEVHVADGQTIADLHMVDVLPPQMQFVQIIALRKNGLAFAATPVSVPSTTVAGGTIDYGFGFVTGGAGADASLEFEFFVPRLDAASARVLDAASADDRLLGNQAYTYGDWTPLDTRDGATRVADQAAVNGTWPSQTVTPDGDPEHVLEAQANAIQKSASDLNGGSLKPGDVVEYTLQFQISDYFAFQNIVIEDSFSDGQRLDGTFAPTLSVTEHGSISAGNFDAVNWASSRF